jgi:hypothetical protein
VTSLGWMLALGRVGLNFSAIYILPQNPAASTLISGVLIETLIGLAQWFVLRAHAAHAGWVIPANALGWGIASMILSHTTYYTSIILALTTPNIPTGLAFWLSIDRRPGGRGANMPSKGQSDPIQQLSS